MRLISTLPLISFYLLTAVVQAEDIQKLEQVESTANSINDNNRLTPALAPQTPEADTSAHLENAAGANVVRNGGLTGIAQLRGLFNDRVRIEIDGMQITPACPNHMDPPLHYTSPSELDNLFVLPGITSVSDGGDSIAGIIKAESIPAEFFDDDTHARGEISVGLDSSNEGRFASARIETGNETYLLSVDGNLASANNIEFARGEIADTGYDTKRGNIGLHVKTRNGIASLEAGIHRSKDAGTPTLPMDMIKDDADHIRLGYNGKHRTHKVKLTVYRHAIDHVMDNFSVRPNSGMKMEAPSESIDSGFSVNVSRPTQTGELSMGLEAHNNELDAFQRNIVSGARQNIMRNATRNRSGLYLEWKQNSRQGWASEYGLRTDYIKSDSDDIQDSFPPSSADQAAFNIGKHENSETHIDATAIWRYSGQSNTDYHIGVSKSTRSPGLLERFLWTPLSSSAGQADGRTYLGNQNLDPEVSWKISLGAEMKQNKFTFSPSLFYNRVKDYIQGTAINRLDKNGKAVLQYQNTDAKLYGVDGNWAWNPMSDLSIGGTVSYVRGKNLDTHDNLYRIAPLNGLVYASLRKGQWTHRAELRAAAKQNKVAAFNDEQESDSWAILNLRTQWSNGALKIRGGVENLLDKNYHDHLAGINRINAGDVDVGDPIPSAGRSAYVEMKYFW